MTLKTQDAGWRREGGLQWRQNGRCHDAVTDPSVSHLVFIVTDVCLALFVLFILNETSGKLCVGSVRAFTCPWMCWIMVPAFPCLTVNSAVEMQAPHTFLSKYSDRRRQRSSIHQNSSGWGGRGGQARGKFDTHLFFTLVSLPVTSFLPDLSYHLYISLCSFSPPVQACWQFLSEVADGSSIKTPQTQLFFFFSFYFWPTACCPTEGESGDWKGKATSVVQPKGRGVDFSEASDRDEQCFALAAELFLTMLWLTNC